MGGRRRRWRGKWCLDIFRIYFSRATHLCVRSLSLALPRSPSFSSISPRPPPPPPAPPTPPPENRPAPSGVLASRLHAYLRRQASFLHHPEDFGRFNVRVNGQFFEMKGEMLTTELRAKVEIANADLPEGGVGEEALGVFEDDVLAEAAAVLALPEDGRGVGGEIQLAAVMQQIGQVRRHPPVGQVAATVLDDGVQIKLERRLAG